MHALDECPEAKGITLSFDIASGTRKLSSK
jgi:hypothetical protein